jgi:hypothetical protein
VLLTPKDIENAGRESGYNYVGRAGGAKAKPWRAQKNAGQAYGGPNTFRGPTRAKPEEAAQDFCEWFNQGQPSVVLAAKPVLKSAGHKRAKRRRLADDPEVAAALGVLRDARGAIAGNQGYVYCITDGEYLKIGYSTKPEARIAELQTGNARALSLVGTIPGTLEDEAAMHVKYQRQNVLAEWFRLDPAIVSEFDPTPRKADAP